MQQDDSPPARPPPIDRESIDVDALKVLGRLTRQGHLAYLVGGCVRDLLLGLHPKDFDVATSATPRQIRRLFRNSRIIGRRFKLAHIHFGPRVIEVATFRAPPVSDAATDPYIRRDNVFGTAKQDARRRDFTVNALFYDVEAERVIDHVGGLADLQARLLRTIGDAELRLREDPVRILRAAKFAGRLGLEPDPELREAAARHCVDLKKAAPPRIMEELFRLLSGKGSADAFRLLEELGAMEILLPEVRPLDERFYAALERLESKTGGSRDGVEQSLLLAVLFWPCIRPVLAQRAAPDVEGLVKARIQPLAMRFTCSRRDSERARQCLAAQARLAHEPKGRTSRRFILRDIFAGALLLREIVGPLRAGEPDTVPAWRELASQSRPKTRGPRRPRRRRRRRRPLSGDA